MIADDVCEGSSRKVAHEVHGGREIRVRDGEDGEGGARGQIRGDSGAGHEGREVGEFTVGREDGGDVERGHGHNGGGRWQGKEKNVGDDDEGR